MTIDRKNGAFYIAAVWGTDVVVNVQDCSWSILYSNWRARIDAKLSAQELEMHHLQTEQSFQDSASLQYILEAGKLME